MVSLGDVPTLDGGGLSEFCLQLGTRLARHLGGDGPLSLVFHLKPGLVGCFGDDVAYAPVSRLHRWHHRHSPAPALWHSLHQLNKNLPPAGTAIRIVTVHDLNYRHTRSGFSAWRHQRRMQRLLARSDALTAISRFTADDVRQHLGFGGPIEVIANGARNLAAGPRQPLPGWSDKPARPFLFHLSRMSRDKNPQALLALAAAWPEMPLVMAGPDNADTRALRAANRLAQVEFHLGISDAQKAWAFGACAGFVFPSLAEGFGLPPIEAMHFGVPVFLSRLTSLPEIGGTVADYLDSFEPLAMRARIEQGLARHAADPGHAAALRAHAAGYSWDRSAEAYVALYHRLLGSTAAAA
jgi:glycosyltransferase involved in cell wall biosynthesis